MSTQVAVWRLGERPSRLPASALPSEKALEDFLEAEPAVIGRPLLVIGRQVTTAHGGIIDLLGLDEAGAVHVVELKRDRTPREIVAQALDYGSWVSGLDNADIDELWARYGAVPLATAFVDRFGIDLPDVLNDEHHLMIVASSLDAATERIVSYLAEQYAVRINVALFTHVVDDDRQYLARTWLLPDAPETQTPGRMGSGRQSRREPWNGIDYCFELGESNGRSWDDARRYGFVSAGGGVRWTGRLREMPVGSTLWVHVPGLGYVGHAETTGTAQLLREASEPGGVLAGADVAATFALADREPDAAEWLLPVRWLASVPREQAVWQPGMYANPGIITQLRQPFTLEVLRASVLAGNDTEQRTAQSVNPNTGTASR